MICMSCGGGISYSVDGVCYHCRSAQDRAIGHKNPNATDLPEEALMADFLSQNGIRFTRPDRDKNSQSTLDFHLIDFGTSIEVKARSTERIHSQILKSGQDGDVIVLVGIKAINTSISLIKGTK